MTAQPTPADAPMQAVVLRERADTLLREAVDAGDAGLWGDTIQHAMVDAAMDLRTEATQLEGPPLEPHDVTSWAAFLPTVRVGGALPVTFRAEGDYVVAEMIVPYVPPVPPAFELFVDNYVGGKIPLAIAEGFPVPVAARYRLPRYSPDTAAHFLRQIVREIYKHEIDEQLRVGDARPFAPEHVS
jgi:hypothetical protein